MTTTLNYEGLADAVDFSISTIIAGSDIQSASFALNTGTIKADWDNAVYGTSCAEFNANGNLTIARYLLPGAGVTEYGESVLFQYPDHVPNVDMTLHSIRAGDFTTGSVNFRLKVLGTANAAPGAVGVAAGTGGTFNLATAAQLTPLAWYRAEIYIKQGTLATNGDMRVKIYPWNSATVVAGSTTVNVLGTATVPLALSTVIEFGVGTILTAPMTTRFDLTRSGVQSAEFGPPPSNTLPVSNAGVNKTGTLGGVITLAGSASDTDGTITTHVWDFSEYASPTKPTFTNGNTATPSFTASTYGRYVLTYHVVDNNGGISPETTVKAFVPTTTPKFIQVVSNSGVVAIGGTILDVVNDLSDATELQTAAGGGASSLRLRLEPMPTMIALTLTLRNLLSVAGTETATIKFWSAGVTRKLWDPTPTDVLVATPLTMSSGECAAVTDWLECDIEFIWGG